MKEATPKSPVSDTEESANERIERLQQEIKVSQFRQVLTTSATRARADLILAKFQAGNLTFEEYQALKPEMQRVYRTVHGNRPFTPDEILGKERKEKKRAEARRVQKESRKERRAGDRRRNG